MTQDFGLAILYLTALAAYLSLGWVIWCAGRWLRRRLWPTFSERVDRRFQPYKPHPLWAERRYTTMEVLELGLKWQKEDAEMEQRRAAWAMGSPGGSCLKEGKTVVIPPLAAQELEELRSTAAMRTTGVATDTVPAEPPPADIPLPTPIVDGLQLAVEDMSWVRRSSLRAVDSSAKTEET